MEKRYQKSNIIFELKDKQGKIKSDKESMMRIVQEYFKKLYTPTKTNRIKQQQLLKNIDKKISQTDKNTLDAPLTDEELQRATRGLNENKSPPLDGITAEFYKEYWYLLKDEYREYINAAKQNSFGKHRNTSVTILIYKNKGENNELDYYRGVSLINVDLKVLTKTLTDRLKHILPSIIHKSQTAVERRRIDHTIHMIRDLIDLAEKEESQAAFIFLDQKNAFDRVEHQFLFEVMEAFGFGEQFITWIKVLYANAYTKVKVNGHLTEEIPIRRGLRQGCTLSMLLYILVIEILALQLRKNPNIIGFQVGGEKIISMHYADDATITITQNRCFKEVIKDLMDYEEATGAKVNYSKTKGLWVGTWKNRTDQPINIEWTSKNVKALGVYFGNESPEKQTFHDILTKIKKSLNYWKQFRLSLFAKARVIEIFHASKLWYAATFYVIPTDIEKNIQNYFWEYINYPHDNSTVSKTEMQKLRQDGGVKVINITCKTDASKIRWLMELANNQELNTHNNIIKRLIGPQKGGIEGVELFFVTKSYAKSIKTEGKFYKSAINAIAKLNVRKKIEDCRQEKVFYNKTFRNGQNITLTPNKTCQQNNINTYGQILDEYERQQNKQSHNRHIANVYKQIKYKELENRQEHQIYKTSSETYITFAESTHKMVYEELIQLQHKDHHSKLKWERRFPQIQIDWKKVWTSILNPIATEDTKTVVWQQIHLNEYTTHSYNKWHNANQACPFCSTIPSSEFHITMECRELETLWVQLEPHLQKLYPNPVTDTEKIFGIIGDEPEIILRNWLTFILRECIVLQERIAFHNKKGKENINDIKISYNQSVKTEVWNKYNIYSNLGRLDYFERIFAAKDYLITRQNNDWQILTLFKI